MKIILSRKHHQAGFMGIVLGILVLALGGVAIYKLYQVAKHMKPVQYNDPTENTNDVTTLYTYGGSKTASVKPTLISYSEPAYLIQPEQPSSFTFQYKVMPCSNGLTARIVTGTNLMDGQVTELVNNDSEYKITFDVGSQNYTEDYDANTGETISEVITPAYTGAPCFVIVQRMTTYIWENVSTNDPCDVGSIYTFSDPNPPSDHAIYRLEIQ